VSASPSSVSDAAPPPEATTADRGLVATAIRTWLRYVIPLTLLSAIALSPLVIIALTLRVPGNAGQAVTTRGLGWALVGVAWLGQLILVGGAAAMTGARLSQRQALTRGCTQLARAVVPCVVAAAAIALGSLALVVPGVLLLVLLSLTGASPDRGLPAPLRDSIAVARRHLPAVAITVAAMLALDAAIGIIAYRASAMPLGRAPTPAQLLAIRTFVRAVVLGLVVLSPLPAMLLATLRHRAGRA
jgi:hypothetical protein